MPVIVCSAYTSEAIVSEGRDYGANEVLVKPVAAESIAKRISHVIDQPRPYIKAPDFFGPDRRRKTQKFPGEEKRIANPDEVKEFHEQPE